MPRKVGKGEEVGKNWTVGERKGSSKLTRAPTAHSIVTVRHGETDWNLGGLIQGQTDEARLTARGKRQARAAAIVLEDQTGGGGRLYSSDLTRAWETAAILAERLGGPVVADWRLRERSFGLLEGRPSAFLHPSFTGIEEGVVVDPDAAPPGGESLREMAERIDGFLRDVPNELSFPQSTPPVVVAHGGSIRLIRALAAGDELEGLVWGPVGNAEVSFVPLREESELLS